MLRDGTRHWAGLQAPYLPYDVGNEAAANTRKLVETHVASSQVASSNQGGVSGETTALRDARRQRTAGRGAGRIVPTTAGKAPLRGITCGLLATAPVAGDPRLGSEWFDAHPLGAMMLNLGVKSAAVNHV